MLQPHLLDILQWASHKKNLFAITCIAATQVIFSPIEGKITGKEALNLRRIVEIWKDGDYTVAQLQIEEFLDQFPTSAAKDHLHIMLGDLYFQEKKYDRAYAAYAKITHPEFIDQALFARLYSLFQLKDYAGVVELEDLYFQKERNPEEALEAHYLMGESLIRMALSLTDPQKKEELAERSALHAQSLKHSKYEKEFLFAFAELQKLLKNYPLAIDSYLTLANQHPERAEEFLFQVATLQVFQDKVAAIGTFKQVALLEGTHKQAATFNLLSLLAEAKNHEELLAEYEKAKDSILPSKALTIQYYVGRSWLALNQFDRAKNSLQCAIQAGQEGQPHFQAALICLINCAHKSSDLDLLTESVDLLQTLYPKGAELAHALLLRAQLRIDHQQAALAYNDLQTIRSTFPEFGDGETMLYTSASLLLKEEKWEESRQLFLQFLTDYPESSKKITAYQHLVNCAFKMQDKPSALLELHKLRDCQEFLGEREKQEVHYLLAKTLYETEEYAQALLLLEAYLEQPSNASHVYRNNLKNRDFDKKGSQNLHAERGTIAERQGQSENANSEINPTQSKTDSSSCFGIYLSEFHLLSASCHQKLESEPSLFIAHIEKALSLNPEHKDADALHLHLFNSYLLLEEGKDKAIEHLTKVFVQGKTPIQWKNQLWLTDYYLSKGRESQADLALAKQIFYQTFHAAEELLSVEALTLHFVQLLSYYAIEEEKIALLEALVSQQTAHPHLDWKYQRLTLFELAKTQEALAQKKEALKIYEELIETSTHTLSYTGSAALLHRARLLLSSLDREQKNEETPLFMQILSDLKELQIRKNIQSEPIHLEAALDYAQLRSMLVEPEKQKEKHLFFLNRIKQDFTSEEDMISKDYTHARKQIAEKEQLFQTYMKYLDAKIMQLSGDAKEASLSLQELFMQSPLNAYLKARLTEDLTALDSNYE